MSNLKRPIKDKYSYIAPNDQKFLEEFTTKLITDLPNGWQISGMDMTAHSLGISLISEDGRTLRLHAKYVEAVGFDYGPLLNILAGLPVVGAVDASPL